MSLVHSAVTVTESRKVIAKLRKVSERPGFAFEHIRVRKTAKTGEMNTYILWAPNGNAIASVYTNAGKVEWARSFRSLLGSQ